MRVLLGHLALSTNDDRMDLGCHEVTHQLLLALEAHYIPLYLQSNIFVTINLLLQSGALPPLEMLFKLPLRLLLVNLHLQLFLLGTPVRQTNS